MPDLYPWILLCSTLLSLECFLVGFIASLSARLKHFTGGKEGFMKQFKYEHQAAFGPKASLAQGGFPDTGNGLYADKLPYKAWFEFNNCMRVHHNFVESLPFILTTILVCGLYTPEATLAIAALNVLTRIVYVVMYMRCGPDKRLPGFVIGQWSLYALSLYTIGYKIHGISAA